MMNAKKIISHIPVLPSLWKDIQNRIRFIRVSRLLNDAPYSRGKQLNELLHRYKQDLPQSDKDRIARIEAERQNLLNSNEPLVDGSLGERGLYDAGIGIKEACKVSKSPKPAKLLYLLTRAVEPKNVIELGTNVGISSAYIGSALQVNGMDGKLTTLDVSPYRQKIANEIHRNIGLENITYVEGLFTDTLKNTLRKIGTVDLAFIDGHHQYQPTLDYFEQIYTYSTPDAVFVFDDIRWSDGMKKAWAELKEDRRLGLVVDFYRFGVCVRSMPDIKERYIFPPLRLK